MTDRAVSDTVGFVLVFGLITTVIAVSVTGGIAGLEDAQHAERDANVERAFDVLHDNMQDIHQDGAPSRATEIRLAGGSLEGGEQSVITVNNTGNENESETIESETIRYTGQGDTEIVYEAGAVIRSDGEGSVMLNEPSWLFTEDGPTMISLVDTNIAPGSTERISGDTTVLIHADKHSRESNDDLSGENGVTITIESPHTDAWEDYFEQYTDPGPEGDSVSATIDTDRLYLIESGVEIRLQN